MDLNNTRIVVADIETTGLAIKLDRIIELGVVEIINGKITTKFSKLFKGGRSHPYLQKSLHRIKDKDRMKQPTFGESAKNIARFLSNCYLITHNGKRFDVPMLQYHLGLEHQLMVETKFIDTLVLTRKVKKFDDTDKNLEFLANYYNLDYGNHRGLGDAVTTFELFKKLCQELNYQNLSEC